MKPERVLNCLQLLCIQVQRASLNMFGESVKLSVETLYHLSTLVLFTTTTTTSVFNMSFMNIGTYRFPACPGPLPVLTVFDWIKHRKERDVTVLKS